jgi:hypothetical protein
MKLTVHFMGLCLFVARDSRHNEFTVYLPDASVAKVMKDGDTVPAHQAWLAVRQGGVQADHRLNHVNVTFETVGAAPSAAPSATDLLDHLVNIPAIAADLRLDVAADLSTVAARIPGVTGGLKPVKAKNRDWTFRESLKPGHGKKMKKMALHVTWTRTFPDGVRIKADNSTIVTLTRNSDVYIMNICGSVDDAINGNLPPVSGTPGQPIEDADFRWFYELLEGEHDTISGRLAGQKLPVPETSHYLLEPAIGKSNDGFMPDTPTCLCGFFCECH